MLFDSLSISNDSLYKRGTYPVGKNNFLILEEYYSPLIEGIRVTLNIGKIIKI